MRNGFYSSLIIVVAVAGVALGDEPQGQVFVPPAGPGTSVQIVPLTGNCAPTCCPQESCCSGGRVWGSAEFLLWRIRDAHVPPLGTAGPPDSTGVLGSPGVVSLFGSSLGADERPGVRFTLGAWLNCD